MVLKIITSIYDLRYEDGRGGMRYKSFPLLAQTIQNIIFDEYEYHKFDESNGVDRFLKDFNISYDVVSTNWIASTAYLIKKI